MVYIQANNVYKLTVGASKVQIKDTGACPGDILTFVCTVYGSLGDSTVWKGTAFSDCNGYEITLLHLRFWLENGTTEECNKGAITGRSMKVEPRDNISNDSLYIYVSQLMVVVQPEMIDSDIECFHDDIDPSKSSKVGNFSWILMSTWCNVNDTSTSPGAGHATMISKVTKLVISSSVIILFTLLLSVTLFLLSYGLRKKISV